MSPSTGPRSLVSVILGATPLALVAVLAFFVLGRSGAALLIGGWTCARAIALVFPRIGAPAAWAGGVVAATGLLLSASAVIAASGVGGDVPFAQSLAVMTPAVVGLAVAVPLKIRARAAIDVVVDRADGLLATAGTAAVLAFFGLMKVAGTGTALAWAMGGDARNHTFIMRRILDVGGITLDELQTYPAAANAIAAVVAGTADRSALDPGELLANDVGAIAAIYVLAIIAGFVLIVAALRQSAPRAGAAVFVPIAGIAGAMVVSAFVLGTALSDGFFSAYVAIPLAIAAVVLGWRAVNPDSGGRAALAALAPATVLVFACWTLLVVIPAGLVLALAIVTALRLVRRDRSREERRPAWPDVLAATTPVAVTAALGLICLVNLERLRATFSLSGAIVTPSPAVAIAVGLTLLGTLAFARGNEARLRAALLVCVALVGVTAVYWLLNLPGAGLTWTYYPVKTLWLIVASLIWAPFVPLLNAATGRGGGLQLRDRIAAGVGTATLAAAIAAVLSLGTAAPSPLLAVRGDWTQPSDEIIDATIAHADDTDPFVFWEWSDTGNDRLGNFWAALAWSVDSDGEFLPDPEDLPGGVTLWAYFATDSIDSLCQLGDGYPGITVITRSPGLAAEAQTSCDEPVTVDVDRE